MIKINSCTPGPWRTFVLKNDKNQTLGHSIHGSNGDKVMFIETPKYKHIEEIECNLALIAAAPQLYEAVKILLEEFGDFIDESNQYRTRAFSIANSAIKKADHGEI